jgi:next-to-BRCA1 protein 1
MSAPNVPVTLDSLIVVKLQFQGNTRKFKIPLRDLGANVLPEKVRRCRAIRAYQQLRREIQG